MSDKHKMTKAVISGWSRRDYIRWRIGQAIGGAVALLFALWAFL